MSNNKRYFNIITHHPNGVSSIDCITENGEYINNNDIKKILKEKLNVDNCIITGVIEMTKEDYEEFYREELKDVTNRKES